jgi:Glycosyl transferase family 2
VKAALSASSRPRVTVVVPVWDQYAGPELAEAISSVQEQDCGCRLIVVDNESSTQINVPEDVQLTASGRRLTLGAARNLGIEQVETEFVIVWDADDVMLPGTLSFLLERMRSDDGLAAFACRILDGETGRRHRWPRPWIARLVAHRRLFATLHCVWSLYPTTGSTIMRTSLVRACGGFTDADSGDDWALGVSLMFRGRVGWDERAGRLYRKTEGSIWTQHSSVSHLSRHARAIRQRIRADAGIPRWAELLLPAIWLGQWIALCLVHVPFEVTRKARRR